MTELGAGELWDPATRADPYPFYARVRAAGRPVPQIVPAGNRFWVVASHQGVVEGLQHPALGHQPIEKRGRGRGGAQARDEVTRIWSRQLIELDPARRAARVDGLGERAQRDPAALELVDDLDEVGHAAPEPVELGQHEHVAGGHLVEQGSEHRAVGTSAGCLLDMNVPLVDAGRAERVELGVETLSRGRNPRVSEVDGHTSDRSENPRRTF